jgi:hypothetical protein
MTLSIALFILAGAALGLGYNRLVGCRTGACLITSNPYASTLYGELGEVFGAMLRVVTGLW